MAKLTRAERELLCYHEDPDIAEYLTSIEDGTVGALYEGGRGASLDPRKDGTLREYRCTLASCWAYLDGVSWQDATKADLEDFIHRPVGLAETPRGLNTATKERSALRGFYKHLRTYERVQFRSLRDDPAAFVRVDPERLRRPEERVPVEDHQWLAVIGCSSLAVDDRLWLGLGYYVGLRREEICTLEPSAIDPLRKRIRFVDRKGGKTKTGLEYGQLVEVLCDHRPEVADGARDWLELVEFYGKYRQGERTLVPDEGVANVGQRLIDRLDHHILPAAGLPHKAFTPHSLRHSFGTNMALCGMELDYIADQMSHSSIETTMRYRNMAGQIEAWRKRNPVGAGPATSNVAGPTRLARVR